MNKQLFHIHDYLLRNWTQSKCSKRNFFLSSTCLLLSFFLSSNNVKASIINDNDNDNENDKPEDKKVDINKFYKGNWSEALLSAFEHNDYVEIPKNTNCIGFVNIVIFPPGKTLIVNGRIEGTKKTVFHLSDNCKLIGNGGELHNISLLLTAGKIHLSGFKMSGFNNVAAILISGSDKMHDLIIDNIIFQKVNYGILRQGFKSSIVNASITNCKFLNLQGDAIEWNVAINDENIVVSDHFIDTIDCTNGKSFWGIGIGFAGSYYDNSYPDEKSVKAFVIKNIVGKNCRQLIHVENGKNFTISNITAENITPDYSKKSGIENATIAVYGSDNFHISNIKMNNCASILIGFGVIKGKYVSVPQNFIIKDVYLKNNSSRTDLRGMQIQSGNSNSFVNLQSINIDGSYLQIFGRPQKLTMKDIFVKIYDKNDKALSFLFNYSNVGLRKFSARGINEIIIDNVHGVDEQGSTSVSSDKLIGSNISTLKSNFALKPFDK